MASIYLLIDERELKTFFEDGKRGFLVDLFFATLNSPHDELPSR